MVSTFGVVFDPVKQQFDWNQFRAFARLDKKSDESLEKYFSCFVAMCRRVCRMPAKPEDGRYMNDEPHCALVVRAMRAGSAGPGALPGDQHASSYRATRPGLPH